MNGALFVMISGAQQMLKLFAGSSGFLYQVKSFDLLMQESLVIII